MPTIVIPLTNTQIDKAKPQLKGYKLFDGGGLFLLVKPNGVKSWRHKFRKKDGKESVIVYGDYPTITLREARQQREKTKQLLLKGLNPVEERQKIIDRLKLDDTFISIADEWLQQTAINKKWVVSHKAGVKSVIDSYLIPTLGHKRIGDITSRDLIKVINAPASAGKIHTARRSRQFLTGIFNHAVFKGLIDHNPAFTLSSLVIEGKSEHRAVIDLKDLPRLINDIRSYTRCSPVTRLALLINLYLFLRASELTYARWSEIDLDKQLWTLPATRQPIDGVTNASRGAKMKTPHLIPLSDQVVILFKELKELTGYGELVFTNDNRAPITNSTPNKALRNLGYTKDQLHFHGFRTLACSVLIESGLFSKDAIERQMSHIERNNVRAAYIHNAEHLAERKAMMNWWSDYITYVSNNGYVAPYDFKNDII